MSKQQKELLKIGFSQTAYDRYMRIGAFQNEASRMDVSGDKNLYPAFSICKTLDNKFIAGNVLVSENDKDKVLKIYPDYVELGQTESVTSNVCIEHATIKGIKTHAEAMDYIQKTPIEDIKKTESIFWSQAPSFKRNTSKGMANDMI